MFKSTFQTNSEWLDGKAVCHLLRVSNRTLQSYRDKGIISFSQFGRKIYYKASDIQEHLERNYIKSNIQKMESHERV